MRSQFTSLYQRLPPSGRSLAASLRGLQLQVSRYDRQLESRVRSALEREYWGPSEWDRATEEALDRVLRAARSAPGYNQNDSGSTLEHFPVTTKAALRSAPKDFWSTADEDDRFIIDRTSGTSGTPLELRINREAVRSWYALLEARLRRWHGLTVNDRWAMFGGQVVVPTERNTPPFWVHNRPMHQLYVSTHHLSRSNAPAIARALVDFSPRYLLGYPSSMALLARYALEDGLQLPTVSVVLSNAEVLTDAQRSVLELAFGAPVRNSYGMAEIVAGASECEHGSLHAWPDAGLFEVKDDAGHITSEPGAKGSYILTGLLNTAMPLVRYEVGDRGTVPVESSCACGRTLPVLGAIEGRAADFLVTPDGRHVFWINPIFTDLPVAEAQVEQYSVDDVEVRVIPSGPWSPEDTSTLTTRLASRLGNQATVRFQLVDEIPRDRSGKFRPVIAHVAKD